MPACFGTDRGAKTFRLGSHRLRSPAETLARLQPSLRRCGVTRIANLTGLDRIGIPVVMVCRPNARSSAVFHGKGISLEAAKVSGVMEAIETWHAETIQLPLRLGSMNDLGSHLDLVDSLSLPRAPGSPFNEDRPLLWIEGRDLVDGATRWVPYEMVHMNATAPEPTGSGCFASDTNGLASGNHLLEAASHALCELIERDALALWRRQPVSAQRRRRLDLGSVPDETCLALIDQIDRAGFDLAVWDVTTDIGVPVFRCLIADRSGEIGHIGEGAGCHPATDIALLRALTEAVQVRMTYVAGSREDIRHADYLPATLESRCRYARALIEGRDEPCKFDGIPSLAFDDFASEVDWVCGCLTGAGLRQVVIVDLSRPGFDVAVVRAVVPGLEGSDHGSTYVPGARADRAAGRP